VKNPETETEYCEESVRIADSSLLKRALLVCFLEAGHDGDLHYDKGDNVSWKIGKPDA
jgi:hypothetical protein